MSKCSLAYSYIFLFVFGFSPMSLSPGVDILLLRREVTNAGPIGFARLLILREYM